MDAKDSIEHFDTAQAHASHLHGGAHPHLVRNAAVLVAILAAFLALATFLSNEAVKEVITGETKAADASARLEANDVKTTVAENDATLLKVLASDNPGERRAAEQAAALEERVVAHYAPIDKELEHQIAEHQYERDHADERHLLFEVSAVGLQIAIVLASISIIARRQWLLGGGAGLGMAAAGVLVAGLLA
ncbi:DUF4337 domain-containing protein [Capillimicrobium parvum]|uniref:DUF4337 domain-containing protein n=1 Tax=Capillimicrobium parvum TaxID=2884022 RepID=A0A9E6Y136_9ACTN|nr:DUF4337 domain-containing protein [Capillimicrobium parvum]UGS38134.1 hypothetical protein DSM104329_04557 [Capillimicrobium parvum]